MEGSSNSLTLSDNILSASGDYQIGPIFKSFYICIIRLLKLIILQKKIVVLGPTDEKVSNFVKALVSLIPVFEREKNSELFQKFGFPLPIFNEKYLLKYCLPVQQLPSVIDRYSGFLVGVTDSNIPSNLKVDVIVKLDKVRIIYANAALRPLIHLDRADRHFGWTVVENVQRKSLAFDSPVDKDDKSIGSDVWVKQEFETYFNSLFSILVKLTFPETKCDEERNVNFSNRLADFNYKYCSAFMGTDCYNEWIQRVDLSYFSQNPHTAHPSKELCGVGFPYDFWQSHIGKFVISSFCLNTCFSFGSGYEATSLLAEDKDI